MTAGIADLLDREIPGSPEPGPRAPLLSAFDVTCLIDLFQIHPFSPSLYCIFTVVISFDQ
ncbi:MAG: hypothetical protein ACLR6B_08515 [Blautia sp.]